MVKIVCAIFISFIFATSFAMFTIEVDVSNVLPSVVQTQSKNTAILQLRHYFLMIHHAAMTLLRISSPQYLINEVTNYVAKSMEQIALSDLNSSSASHEISQIKQKNIKTVKV